MRKCPDFLALLKFKEKTSVTEKTLSHRAEIRKKINDTEGEYA